MSAAEQEAETTSGATSSVRAPRRSTATILLVDDDDATRETASMILEVLGFDVLAAPSGPAALQLARDADRVDLLLTDVRMPGMNGVELAKELSERFPSTPVLFMSGYASGAMRDGNLPEGAAFLAKPFTIDDLESCVREALAGAT